MPAPPSRSETERVGGLGGADSGGGGSGFGGGWSGGFGSNPSSGGDGSSGGMGSPPGGSGSGGPGWGGGRDGGGYSGGFSQSQFGGGGFGSLSGGYSGPGGFSQSQFGGGIGSPGGLLGGGYGLPRQNPFSDPSRFRFGSPFGITREKLAGVNPSVLSRIVGLQAAYGKPLGITSGYRSKTYNKKVGGAPGSQHISGTAIDISLPDKTEAATAEFLGLASQYGFTGLGVYSPGSVHVDTGPKRAWGPDRSSSSIQGWMGPTIARHMAGDFGTAPQSMSQAPSVAMTGAPTTTASLAPGIGPGASAQASATPTYPDAPQGSWGDYLGNLLGSGYEAARAYGSNYLAQAKSPDNIGKFAARNPGAAMQLASAFGSLSPGEFGPGGGGIDRTGRGGEAQAWFQSPSKAKDKDKDRDSGKPKKKPGDRNARYRRRWVYPAMLTRPYTFIS